MTTSRFRTASSARSTGDEGLAFLVVVVALGAALAILMTTLFYTAGDNISSESNTVEQAQALQAAQSGINLTYRTIATTPTVADLPCVVSGPLGSSPRVSSYTVAITWFSTAAAASPITCSGGKVGSATPQAALLTSTGTDGIETVKMVSEALVTVTAADKARIENGFFNQS